MELANTHSALLFAVEAHSKQVRKYTGEPYLAHLAEVAGIAAACAPRNLHRVMVCVSLLHDCMEDQGVTHDELVERFGDVVAGGVRLLSDLEPGNRASRKAAARERLARAPGWVQTIKCADLISNAPSIIKHDPKFAAVYREEARLLLGRLTDADPCLRHYATNLMSEE